MQQWQADKLKTDRVMPLVQGILGKFLFRPGTEEEDQKEATDLRILVAGDQRIAVRLRDDSYRVKYGGEFTLRNSRPSGALTECEKIMMGLAQWMFYGFVDYESNKVTSYVILNLNFVRLYLWRSKAVMDAFIFRNEDNSSDFIAIKLEDLPTGAIAHRFPKIADNLQDNRMPRGELCRVS